MTKSITVQQHGEPQEFDNVARLDTKIMGGTAMTWLPDDETQTGTLEVTQNGEYLAESEGLYGYSEVVVNVPIEERDRCVFGYEQDGRYAVMACVRNGIMMARMFPSYIKIAPISQSMALMRSFDSTLELFDITLMTASDAIYRNLMSSEEMGILTDVQMPPEAWKVEARQWAYLDDTDILYAADGTGTGEGTDAIEEGRGRYMSVVDSLGNTIYGRAKYYVAHPEYFAAVPKWVAGFSTFMDGDFNLGEYMIFGREVDGDVKAPSYIKDGFKLCYEFYTDGNDGAGYMHRVPVENVQGDIF